MERLHTLLDNDVGKRLNDVRGVCVWLLLFFGEMGWVGVVGLDVIF